MKNIEAAIAKYYENGKDDLKAVHQVIKDEMNGGAKIIVPVIIADEGVMAQYLNDSTQNVWCAVFTDMKEVPDGENKMLGSCPLIDIVQQVYRDSECQGIVFNVFGNSIFMDKEEVEGLLRMF